MSSSYPWSILGIPAQSGPEAIRRAYARKLKTTRPDDDPEGFKKLVEARDRALSLIADDTVSSPKSSGTADSDQAGGLRNDFSRSTDLSAADLACETVIREGLAQRPSAGDIETWHSILTAVGDMTLWRRRDFEADIILALHEAFRGGTIHVPFTWWPIFQKRLLEADKAAAYASRAFRSVVCAFIDEFDWNFNDVGIVRVLGDPKDVNDFFQFMAAVRKRQSAEDGMMPTRRDLDGLPIFDSHDVDSLFPEERRNIVQTLERRRANGRWPPGWQWRLAVSAPVFALVRCPVRYLAAWFVGLGLSLLLREGLHPLLPPLVAEPLSWLPLIAYHAWMMAFGYRGEIEHAQRYVEKADRELLFEPTLRSRYLGTVHDAFKTKMLLPVVVIFVGSVAFVQMKSDISRKATPGLAPQWVDIGECGQKDLPPRKRDLCETIDKDKFLKK